jgi:hypothetical protein
MRLCYAFFRDPMVSLMPKNDKLSSQSLSSASLTPFARILVNKFSSISNVVVIHIWICVDRLSDIKSILIRLVPSTFYAMYSHLLKLYHACLVVRRLIKNTAAREVA